MFICSILTGHMDGSLQLIGHNGRILNSIQAHEKPVSVLKYCGDKVITGSYDSVVLVHRTVDFFCLNSVEIHRGGITALALVGVRNHLGNQAISGINACQRFFENLNDLGYKLL